METNYTATLNANVISVNPDEAHVDVCGVGTMTIPGWIAEMEEWDLGDIISLRLSPGDKEVLLNNGLWFTFSKDN